MSEGHLANEGFRTAAWVAHCSGLAQPVGEGWLHNLRLHQTAPRETLFTFRPQRIAKWRRLTASRPVATRRPPSATSLFDDDVGVRFATS